MPTAPAPPSPVVVSDEYSGDEVARAAKSVVALFGLLLIVVLPVGAFISDRGVMTPREKAIVQENSINIAPTNGYNVQHKSLEQGDVPATEEPSRASSSLNNTSQSSHTEQEMLLLNLEQDVLSYRQTHPSFSGYLAQAKSLPHARGRGGCVISPIWSLDVPENAKKFSILVAESCGNDSIYLCVDTQELGKIYRVLSQNVMAVRAAASCTALPISGDSSGGISQSLSVEERTRMSALVLGVSQSVRDYATNCRRNSGAIRSGSGGERLCSVSNYTLSWPSLSVCGTSPADTKWTVFRGDTDTWDITITCTERPGCDGPSNALCTKDGCTFSETCLPK